MNLSFKRKCEFILNRYTNSSEQFLYIQLSKLIEIQNKKKKIKQ